MEPTPVRQRRRYTKEQRRQFVERFRQSGLSQSAFAQQHDLKLCTLGQWIRQSDKPVQAPPAFREVEIPTGAWANPWSAELVLGKELTVRLSTAPAPEFIARILEVLRR